MTPIDNRQDAQVINISLDPTGSVGSLRFFGGAFNPYNSLEPDGSELSISAYPSLFSTIGSAFGGDGRSTLQYPTFTMPYLSGRGGAGQGPGLSN